MNRISIYTVSHKRFNPPKNGIYIPIQVGKRFSGLDLGYLSDDTGDNIAERNKNYCELTALYWIWKNASSDIVGLCHYRRYFTKNGFSSREKCFLDEKSIEKYLLSSDIIVPRKFYWNCTVAECYTRGAGKQKDLQNTRNIIQTKYPEYLDDFDAVLASDNAFYCNMFIAKKQLVDQYCEWLFDILMSLEEITDLTGYTVQEARIYGYLSELLLNVWISKNGLDYAEVPVVNTDEKMRTRFRRSVSNIIRRVGSRLW